MDTTMAQWLTSRRVRMAKDLLISSDMSIAEISRRCGFGSSSYFCNVFARTLGVSPARWRDSQQISGQQMGSSVMAH
jgi:AraC-like DNA-binding protein